MKIEMVADAFKTDASSLLDKGFGEPREGKIVLSPEEALYLCEFKGAVIVDQGGEVDFHTLFSRLSKQPGFIQRYFVFRDMRLRGLVVKKQQAISNPAPTRVKTYDSQPRPLPCFSIKGVFFPDAMLSISSERLGKELFEQYWFGQYGTYKAPQSGKFVKFDVFETVYLLNKGLLTLDVGKDEVLSIGRERIRFFDDIFGVYSDWRDHGFIVKTGFKFGTHFRLYMPQARPTVKDKYLHSKHLLHVFSSDEGMLVSEWARVVRVAHSVRKTFVLAIPTSTTQEEIRPDFITPNQKTAIFCFSEDTYLSGRMFASALNTCNMLGTSMLMSIVDRETSTTYYSIRPISFKNKSDKYEYYEIEWVQPTKIVR